MRADQGIRLVESPIHIPLFPHFVTLAANYGCDGNGLGSSPLSTRKNNMPIWVIRIPVRELETGSLVCLIQDEVQALRVESR